MKKVKIINIKTLQEYGTLQEDPSEFINFNVSINGWGKPERWVRKKREGTNELGEPTIVYPDEVYEDLDVLGEEERPLFPHFQPQSIEGEIDFVSPDMAPSGIVPSETYVLLRAEYTIEITDVTEELGKANCKALAKTLIAELDWVLDTETQPLLSNRSEFIAYRSQLRQLIITPQVDPVFPNRPDEVWAD
jgi:hypothetical protein